MTNFISEIHNMYELSARAERVELPAKQVNRMAEAILDIDEYIKTVNEVTSRPENKGATISTIMNETLGVISQILEGERK